LLLLLCLQVELLEQFYEALCSLVERLRLSDPLSLTLVHKVGVCSHTHTGWLKLGSMQL
jgi:hypothetical protein